MSKQLVARQTPALNQTINLVRNTCNVVGMVLEEDKNMNLEEMKALNNQSACIMESYKAICNDNTATLDEKRQSIAEMKEHYNVSVQVNQNIIKEKRKSNALYMGIAVIGAILFAAITNGGKDK